VPREAGVITVRRAEPSDYEGICETFRDESAYSGTLQLPCPSAEIWRKRLAEPKLDEPMLVAFVDGRMAGNAGLHRTALSPRRAHAMLPCLAVLYRKHGFEVEGTHRAYALRAGKYADTLSMARIKHKT
jgi:L-phenylalanine/L-methionine N-acetyltransferase